MRGIFQWVKDAAQSAYDGISAFSSAVSTVVTTTYKACTSISLQQWAGKWFADAWLGFSQLIYSPIIPPRIAHPKTAAALSAGRASVLLRLGQIVFYHRAARPLINFALRETAGNNMVTTAALSALDMAAYLYLVCHTVDRFTDRTVYQLAVAKASADESQQQGQHNNPLMTPCLHDGKPDMVSQIVGDVYSNIYYVGGFVALEMLAYDRPFLRLLTLPLEMLVCGRAFLEYPLAAAGNCTEHRLQVLNRNNAYAVGIGASYILSFKVLQNLTAYGCHVSGFFVDETLLALLSLQLIAALNLDRSKTLPGKTAGVDWLYASRKFTDFVIAETAGYINYQLSLSTDGSLYQMGREALGLPDVQGDLYQMLRHDARAVWGMRGPEMMRQWLLPTSFSDWDHVAYRDSSRMLLALYGKDLAAGLQWVQDQRAQLSYQVVNDYKQWIPNFLVSKGDKETLAVLMREEIELPLISWLSFFKSVSDPDFKPPKTRVLQAEERVEILDDYEPAKPQKRSAAGVSLRRPDKAVSVSQPAKVGIYTKTPSKHPKRGMSMMDHTNDIVAAMQNKK